MNSSPFAHDIGDTLHITPLGPPDNIIARHAGGFGVVYIVESEDPAISITALKSIRVDLKLNKEILDQFTNEGTLWSNLPEHPLILPLFSVRRYNDLPYLRMPYIPPVNKYGSSLASFLREARETRKPSGLIGLPSDGTVMYIFFQIIEALSFLENELDDFSHGDIKPSNLLLRNVSGEDTRVILADFGLAKAFGFALKEKGYFACDTRYTAPELLTGSKHSVSTDIYSVGCTLFEMLTGSVFQEYDRYSHRMFCADLEDALSYIRSYRKDLPSGILSLIIKCLSKDPSDRPKSFLELKQEFMSEAESDYYFFKQKFKKQTSPSWIMDVEDSPAYKYLIRRKHLLPDHAKSICLQLSKAANLRATGAFAAAENEVNRVLKDIPQYAPALAGNAHGYLLEGKYDFAIDYYLRAIREFEDDDELLAAERNSYGGACVSLAQLLPQVKRNKASIILSLSLAEKGIKVFPNEPRAYLAMGICQVWSGEYRTAVDTLRTAYDFDPNNSKVKIFLVSSLLLSSSNRDAKFTGLISEYKLESFEVKAVRQLIVQIGD